MKTSESLKERKIESGASAPHEELESLQGLEPERALLLSVVPGLGQIYNGEVVKGLLFVSVSAANLLLLCLLLFTGPLLSSISQGASLFHASTRINVEQILDIVRSEKTATMVYLGLIAGFTAFVAKDAYDRAREKRRGKILPRFALNLTEAASGSYLAHFALICFLLLMVIIFWAPPKRQVQSTDIELVQEVEAPPPKKAPEPPKPRPKSENPPEVKKLEPRKVEQAPLKPTPVAVAVPSDKPVADSVVQSDQPAAPPSSSQSSDSTGSAGGSSSGQDAAGGDGDDFDFGSYLSQVQKKIKKSWFPPRGAESLSVVLKFKVLKDGTAVNIRLVKSSGQSVADEAAKIAVQNASPFAALPKAAGDDVDIKFTFDYNVFNGRLPAQQ